MRLTQIKLSGFKSFVDSTSIPTPSQLVGVVGPNGCGKSNIIDAVRWVLGESRASEMRGESMQDVIFNGSTNRKAAGRASVELFFDNSEQRVQGQWSTFAELSVRRVLTREGFSAYYINNQQVRRRDVYDLFSGTGLGAKGYAIIGQGMINRLIEAKPEQLRVYLEEAAGVSRYKERRRETENRLQETHENLNRVEDIQHELNRRVNQLEKQAKIASEFHELKQEGEEKQHALWFLREENAKQLQLKFSQQTLAQEEDLKQQVQALEQSHQEVEKHRLNYQQATELMHQQQATFYEINNKVQRLETEMKHQKETQNRLLTRQDQLKQQIKEWQEQKTYCQEQLALVTEELEESLALEEDSNIQLEECRDQLPSAEDAFRISFKELEQLRSEKVEQAHQKKLLQHQEKEIDIHKNRLQERQQKLKQEQNSIQLIDEQEASTLKTEILQLEAKISEYQTALIKNETELSTQQAHEKQLNVECQTIDNQLAELQAHAKALKQLQQDLTQNQSMEEWLDNMQLSQLSPLIKNIQVKEGWEKAIESYLREKLFALCLKDHDSLKVLLEQPPSQRLQVYAQTMLSTADSQQYVSQGNSNVRALLSSPDEHLTELLDYIFYNVFYATSFEEGVLLLEKQPYGAQVLLKEGHVIDHAGLAFYANENAQDGMLLRQQEIKHLEHEIKAMYVIQQEAFAKLEQTQKILERQSEKVASTRLELAELTELRHEKKLKSQELDQKSQQQQMLNQRLDQELEEITVQYEELFARQEELLIELESYSQKEFDLDNALENLLSSHQDDEQKLDKLKQKYQALEREQTAQSYEVKSYQARIHELERNERIVKDQLLGAQNELQQLKQEWLDVNEMDGLEQLQSLKEEKAVQEELMINHRKSLDDLMQATRKSDEQRLKLEQSIEPLREKIVKSQLEEQEARLTVEQFAEQLDLHEVDREDIRNTLKNKNEQWHTVDWLQAQIHKVSKQIDQLGSVNLAALDELHEAQERKSFYDTQQADLHEAMVTLEEAIRKIDKETRGLLHDTFEQVNQHFASLFPQLFGGGQAQLKMTGEEILDAGVQVMAQPPGKKNSSIHLLSGGEKALTATALVFALFKLNPAPFCLLDEVDAPLDDANTERYAKLVTAMSDQTQFLFISHNKIAMQMAKQLIGVTMQEQGVSRIVAVDIEAAVQLAEV